MKQHKATIIIKVEYTDLGLTIMPVLRRLLDAEADAGVITSKNSIIEDWGESN